MIAFRRFARSLATPYERYEVTQLLLISVDDEKGLPDCDVL